MSLDLQSSSALLHDNVRPLRKALDGQVADGEDWLTPMPDETRFVVCQYANSIYLDVFEKVCNHDHCVVLMEDYNNETYRRYVIAQNFCNKYRLVEKIYIP